MDGGRLRVLFELELSREQVTKFRVSGSLRVGVRGEKLAFVVSRKRSW